MTNVRSLKLILKVNGKIIRKMRSNHYLLKVIPHNKITSRMEKGRTKQLGAAFILVHISHTFMNKN